MNTLNINQARAMVEAKVKTEEELDSWLSQCCKGCLQESAVIVIQTACQHVYCKLCLNELFRRGLEWSGSFPPSCCVPVDLQTAHDFLEQDVMRRYDQVKEEFSSINPTYCGVKRCAVFLTGNVIHDNIATCGKCGSRTCVKCKNLMEDHSSGASDSPDPLVLCGIKELVKAQEWSICPRCTQVIELIEGCEDVV